MNTRSYLRPIAFGVVALVGSSCQESLDTTRTSARVGTLGEDIHYTACRRFASDAYPEDVSGMRSRALCRGEEAATAETPPQLRAIADNRPRLVPALDTTLPDAQHDALEQLLVDILPLYEAPAEILPTQSRALGAQVEALAADPAIPPILGRFSSRVGYRPARYALGIARPSLAYSEMPTVINRVLGAVGPTGYARAEFDAVLEAASLELATASVDATTPGWKSTLTLTRELLLRPAAHPALPTFASGTPRYAIRRDVRGMVLPEPVAADPVPDPFVDMDGDLLADVDGQGRFVDAAGAVLAVPPPFRPNGEDATVSRDASGRALRADNSLYYQYVDADNTLLRALLRESPALLDSADPALLHAAYGISAMFGTDSARTETYGASTFAFTGPDPTTGPMFDGIHGAAQVMPRVQTVDLLTSLGAILVGAEPQISGLVYGMLDADARADMHPEAVLSHQPNVFWDDVLLPVEAISRGATNGSSQRPLDALMRTLLSPQTQAMTVILPLFATMKDAVSFDPSAPNNAIPQNPAMTTPVDRTMPDTATNESLLQRSLHLIADLNGASLCNKEGALVELFPGVFLQPTAGHETADTGDSPNAFAACQLVNIQNMGQAFAQSALGRYEVEFTEPKIGDLVTTLGRPTVDALLQSNSGITGFDTQPTAAAMARFVFTDRNAWLDAQFDEPLTRYGLPVEDVHCIGRAAGDRSVPCPNAVIFAWEKPIGLPSGGTATFLQAVTPLLTALDDADTGTNFFFGDLSSALHRHWASTQATRTQSSNPAGDNFSYQDDVRSYEPLIADIVGNSRIIARLGGAIGALAAVLQNPPAVPLVAAPNGVAALSNATELLLRPELSCPGGVCATASLTYRDGRNYICANDGTCFDGNGGRPHRYPSPLYMVLDALHAADDAWVNSPERHAAWLTARSALVDQLLTVDVSVPATPRFANPHSRSIVFTILRHVNEQIGFHLTADADNGRAWANSITTDTVDAFGSPVAAALLDLMDELYLNADARTTFAALLAYLVDEASPNEGFDANLLAVIDLLHLLEDEASTVPLLHALAPSLASNANTVVSGGGTVDSTGSLIDATITVLNEIDARDPSHAIAAVLAASVALPASGDPEASLETVGDVIAEVNRVTPDSGQPLSAEDWVVLLNSVRDFAVATDNGLERLYAVIQNRSIP